ncbi:MAG: 2Fe-2S iron-sulfur cluster-binding protein [Kiritimatiellae bacterium]|nr:2Fe-2S iron-sulfur cluster-binding protein [Kiritimatiellia bacterium]
MSVRVIVDGRAVELPDGATLLEATRALGIRVPTLCHRDGLPHYTSCMVCAVRELSGGRLLPACSYPATDGMEVDASSDEVRAARRRVLELLLSEHVGDCEAPCRRACPAHLRIPELLRDAARGAWAQAARLAAEDLVLPAALGRICPAPCERSCRRAQHDAALPIRELHRRLGESPELAGARQRPAATSPRTARVTVVGAGPAGLAAAAFLRRAGVEVTLRDRALQPGGALRDPAVSDRLPAHVLDAEIREVLAAGIRFEPGADVLEPGALDRWIENADAVVLACGALDARSIAALGLESGPRGVRADANTRQTSRRGVFAAGAMVQPMRLAVRAVADGRLAAEAVLVWLELRPAPPWPVRFDSRIGPLHPSEVAQWLPDASPASPGWPDTESGTALDDRAAADARRCLGCDCRKARSCRLRRLADEYRASPARFAATARPPVILRRDHPRLVYEPGKCIHCGICVRLAARSRGTMTFQRRGYEQQVAPAFNNGLDAGLGAAADEAVRACPTAALAFRTWEPISGISR